MNITAEELAKLNAADTEDEWNAVCDDVKTARDGEYPPDWFVKVMRSGVLNAALLRFT